MRNKVPNDSSRVDVYERHEVEYWTKKLGCSAAELRTAVEATGSIMADKIEAYLKIRIKSQST
jgi:hypothetical protein